VTGDIIVLISSLKMFQTFSQIINDRVQHRWGLVDLHVRAYKYTQDLYMYPTINMYNVFAYCHVGNLSDTVVKDRLLTLMNLGTQTTTARFEVGKVCVRPVALTAGAYSSFCSMKQLGVSLLPRR